MVGGLGVRFQFETIITLSHQIRSANLQPSIRQVVASFGWERSGFDDWFDYAFLTNFSFGDRLGESLAFPELQWVRWYFFIGRLP